MQRVNIGEEMICWDLIVAAFLELIKVLNNCFFCNWNKWLRTYVFVISQIKFFKVILTITTIRK